MKGHREIGRLAMRQEGANWVAYYAMPSMMEGALFLGSIRMKFVADRRDRMTAFMDFMREAVGDIIEEETGVRPVWGGPQTAPESERSGSA